MYLCIAAAALLNAQARPLPRGAFAQNVEYVGFTNLNGHLPFKVDIQQVNGRTFYSHAATQPRSHAVTQPRRHGDTGT